MTTTSTVRLWDGYFRHLATEDIPDDEITITADSIRIEHRELASPLASAMHNVIERLRRGEGVVTDVLKVHITIDPDPNNLNDWESRRGGIVTAFDFKAGGLTIINAAPHTHTPPDPKPETGNHPKPETIYPPRGYGIGLPGGGNSDHAIIGCWATEDEARQAISEMRVFVLGDARPSWDNR
ncbi:Radical SAM domain protein [Mycolicibacterium canariasense]|uniref:Radical SAM domain protein n=1 Tax=Mycolicibacterium canariasense TaxID=228230 RepID=A0A100W9S8_MYCCR|nr:hypothetical protein [Mycolicibacterium canariasense]MCV7208804.1 hypothetical protein [Mycolicibacterium canariasense]ORV07131.1 hypothetical protein AWB94_14105 [Mycolicibacterium canariasense]GAS94409.1 Radical SAM domain protein [Mycolicibacterium canariasense]